MARYHLRCKNLHPGTVEAADRLFDAKPWKLEDPRDQERVVQQFLDTVSPFYGVESPEFVINPEADYPFDMENVYPPTDDFGNPVGDAAGRPRIIEQYLSLTSMFFVFRGYVNVRNPEKALSPMSFAASLFYAVRPCQFRRKVRQGRIQGVSAEDTYRRETWDRMCAAGWVDDRGTLWRGSWPTIEELQHLLSSPVEEAERFLSEMNDGLDALGVTELRRLASQYQIPGAWTNTKNQNIAALRRLGVVTSA